MAGATGVAGRRRVAYNQQLQPSEILALYFRRIRRAGVSGWATRCGPGMRRLLASSSQPLLVQGRWSLDGYLFQRARFS